MTKLSIKVNGITIKLKEKVYFGTLKVIFTLEISKTTKLTDLEFINMSMEADMKVYGLMMCNKDKEKKYGSMEPNI